MRLCEMSKNQFTDANRINQFTKWKDESVYKNILKQFVCSSVQTLTVISKTALVLNWINQTNQVNSGISVQFNKNNKYTVHFCSPK